jgi:site-specific recombinase
MNKGALALACGIGDFGETLFDQFSGAAASSARSSARATSVEVFFMLSRLARWLARIATARTLA